MHSCEICGKSFINSTILKYHSTVHTGKSFSCDVCEKSFTCSSSLVKHKKLVHQRVYSSICSHCGKRFTTESTLKDHITTHTGKKRFPCDNCKKSFNRYSNLSTHKLTVHKDVPSHSCKICAKRFETLAKLTEHITTAHRKSERNSYAYDQCDETFLLPVSLFNHKRTIQELHSFVCEICNKSFLTSTHFKHHLSSVHIGDKG